MAKLPFHETVTLISIPAPSPLRDLLDPGRSAPSPQTFALCPQTLIVNWSTSGVVKNNTCESHLSKLMCFLACHAPVRKVCLFSHTEKQNICFCTPQTLAPSPTPDTNPKPAPDVADDGDLHSRATTPFTPSSTAARVTPYHRCGLGHDLRQPV